MVRVLIGFQPPFRRRQRLDRMAIRVGQGQVLVAADPEHDPAGRDHQHRVVRVLGKALIFDRDRLRARLVQRDIPERDLARERDDLRADLLTRHPARHDVLDPFRFGIHDEIALVGRRAAAGRHVFEHEPDELARVERDREAGAGLEHGVADLMEIRTRIHPEIRQLLDRHRVGAVVAQHEVLRLALVPAANLAKVERVRIADQIRDLGQRDQRDLRLESLRRDVVFDHERALVRLGVLRVVRNVNRGRVAGRQRREGGPRERELGARPGFQIHLFEMDRPAGARMLQRHGPLNRIPLVHGPERDAARRHQEHHVRGNPPAAARAAALSPQRDHRGQKNQCVNGLHVPCLLIADPARKDSSKIVADNLPKKGPSAHPARVPSSPCPYPCPFPWP